MSTLTERLQTYMDYKGLNYNQVTVQAGLSIGQIGRAIKSNKGLHSDSIEKIINTYQDLNPEWLLSGSGDMIKNELGRKDKDSVERFDKMNTQNEPPLNRSAEIQGNDKEENEAKQNDKELIMQEIPRINGIRSKILQTKEDQRSLLSLLRSYEILQKKYKEQDVVSEVDSLLMSCKSFINSYDPSYNLDEDFELYMTKKIDFEEFEYRYYKKYIAIEKPIREVLKKYVTTLRDMQNDLVNFHNSNVVSNRENDDQD